MYNNLMKSIIKLIFIMSITYVCYIHDSCAGKLLDIVSTMHAESDVDSKKIFDNFEFTDEEVLEALHDVANKQQDEKILSLICTKAKQRKRLHLINLSYRNSQPIILTYARYGKTNIVVMLIDEYEANPNVVRSSDGMTALGLAAMQNHHETCIALLGRGANKDMLIKGKTRTDGKPSTIFTALSLSTATKHYDLAKTLSKWPLPPSLSTSRDKEKLTKIKHVMIVGKELVIPAIELQKFESAFNKGINELESYIIIQHLKLLMRLYQDISEDEFKIAKFAIVNFVKSKDYRHPRGIFNWCHAIGMPTEIKNKELQAFNVAIHKKVKEIIAWLKENRLSDRSFESMDEENLRLLRRNRIAKMKEEILSQCKRTVQEEAEKYLRVRDGQANAHVDEFYKYSPIKYE